MAVAWATAPPAIAPRSLGTAGIGPDRQPRDRDQPLWTVRRFLTRNVDPFSSTCRYHFPTTRVILSTCSHTAASRVRESVRGMWAHPAGVQVASVAATPLYVVHAIRRARFSFKGLARYKYVAAPLRVPLT